MAKVKLGPMIGQASGSIAAAVFSHNRYGAYIRQRSIPITSTTEDALTQKALMGGISAAFAALTADQKLQWAQWAQSNPITDRLGDQQHLTGHAAYVQINMRLQKMGTAELTTPPVGPSPLAFTSFVLTADVGAGSVSIAFAATPMVGNQRMVVQACCVDTAAINYVDNLYRTIGYGGIPQASPFDIEAIYVAKFGTPQVGNYMHVKGWVLDQDTGLTSPPMRSSVIVTTT